MQLYKTLVNMIIVRNNCIYFVVMLGLVIRGLALLISHNVASLAEVLR